MRERRPDVLLAMGSYASVGPVWAALRGHPYFAIKEIQVRGAGPLLSPPEIREWVGVRDGAAIWDLSPLKTNGSRM